MATDFLNYKIDKALLKQNGEHDRNSCVACVDRKSAGCLGGWLGLRHVQVLYWALSAALLMACNQAAATALPQIVGLIPSSPRAPIYDWNCLQCGAFLSSSSIGYGLATVCRIRGGRKLLMAALFTDGALLIALPAIIDRGGWYCACLVRALIGITSAAVVPSLHEVLVRWLPPHERSFIAPFVYDGGLTGAAVALAGCAVLGASVPGWPLAMYLLGAFALAGFTFLLFLTSDTPKSLQAMTEEERDYIDEHNCIYPEIKFRIPWRRILSSRAAWASGFGQLCCDIPYWLLMYLMPIYLTRVLHYDYTQSAVLCALSWAAGWAVGSLRPNRPVYIFGLDVRPSDKFVYCLGACGTAACLCGTALGGTRATSVALLVPIFSTLQSISLVDAQVSISPRFAACCMTLRSTVGSTSGLLPIAAAHVLSVFEVEEKEATAWRVLFFCCAAIVLVGAIIFLVFGFVVPPIWDDAPRQCNGFRIDHRRIKQRAFNRIQIIYTVSFGRLVTKLMMAVVTAFNPHWTIMGAYVLIPSNLNVIGGGVVKDSLELENLKGDKENISHANNIEDSI